MASSTIAEAERSSGEPLSSENLELFAVVAVATNTKSKKEIIELGAKDQLLLKNFRDKIGSQSKFLGLNDDQYPLTSFKDAPSVNEVYKELKIN